MTKLSIGHVAQQAGVSESIVLRAIQEGWLYASQDEDGSWTVDSAEFRRAYYYLPVNHSRSVTNVEDAACRTAWMSAALEAQVQDLEVRLENVREHAPQPRRQIKGLLGGFNLLELIGCLGKPSQAA